MKALASEIVAARKPIDYDELIGYLLKKHGALMCSFAN
jgi:hypothetical protein